MKSMECGVYGDCDCGTWEETIGDTLQCSVLWDAKFSKMTCISENCRDGRTTRVVSSHVVMVPSFSG